MGSVPVITLRPLTTSVLARTSAVDWDMTLTECVPDPEFLLHET